MCAGELQPDFARTRTVVLHKKEALPGAEHHLSPLDDQQLRGVGEGALDVGVGIALAVGIPRFLRDGAVEESGKIAAHIGIGILVDGEAGGGMGTKDRHRPALRADFAQKGADEGGDINDIAAAAGADGNSLHACVLSQGPQFRAMKCLIRKLANRSIKNKRKL